MADDAASEPSRANERSPVPANTEIMPPGLIERIQWNWSSLTRILP